MLKKDVNMLSGSIVRGLLSITMPIMIMNVVQSVFNIVDMTVLKTFSGDTYAVGAVGICSTLITLITGLLVGCSSGANVVIARYIGRGDPRRVERAVGASILFSIVGGIAVAILGISCAEIFLVWMNCPDVILGKATLYFRLYFAGVPFSMVYNFCASALRAAGDSRRPMLFLTAGGILKVGFNIVFVGVCKLSVLGVALATIISFGASCALGVIALSKNKNSIVRLKLSRMRFYKQELSEIVTIGVPAGLQHALYSVANVIISATVNSFGPAATTGISIANNFDGILYQIVVAPSLAVMPYVSQNLGARSLRRAKKSVLCGIGITVAFGATIGALSAIFSGQLSSIMSSDPVVIAYSRQKMMLISGTYFICGINEVMGASMRGLGRSVIPTVSTLLFQCGIRFVWVYAVFPLYPHLTFLYLIWPIGWLLSIITVTSFYLPIVKRLGARLSTPEN